MAMIHFLGIQGYLMLLNSGALSTRKWPQ